MTKIPRLFELMKEHGISSKKLSDDTKIVKGAREALANIGIL